MLYVSSEILIALTEKQNFTLTIGAWLVTQLVGNINDRTTIYILL